MKPTRKINWTMAMVFLVSLAVGWIWNAANLHAAQMAVVATAAPDYSSGAHSVISVDPVGGPRTAQNELASTITADVTVDAHGRYFYRMERFMMDNIAKFDILAPDTPVWQFTTNDADESASSNPSALIFVDEAKAYLLRYGSATAWIVNPSAAAEAEFKTGELDLSAYADADGLPEMIGGAIAGDRLFIVMQRMDRDADWTPGTAYVAVFDTATDTEIDTGLGAEGRNGIPLAIKNPEAVVYLPENDSIYIQGSGRFESMWSGTPADYSGGIVQLNPETFETRIVLDDGDDANHPHGNISGMAVISAAKGYFVAYNGWGDNTLYAFNPTTGAVGNAVEGLANKNIAGMNSGIYPDQNHMLWVSNQTDAEVVILDTADDVIDERVSTGLNPMKVVFCDTDQSNDNTDDATGEDDGGGSGGCFVGSMTGMNPAGRVFGAMAFSLCCFGCGTMVSMGRNQRE